MRWLFIDEIPICLLGSLFCVCVAYGSLKTEITVSEFVTYRLELFSVTSVMTVGRAELSRKHRSVRFHWSYWTNGTRRRSRLATVSVGNAHMSFGGLMFSFIIIVCCLGPMAAAWCGTSPVLAYFFDILADVCTDFKIYIEISSS